MVWRRDGVGLSGLRKERLDRGFESCARGEEDGDGGSGDLSSWRSPCLLCEFSAWDSTRRHPHENM